MTKTYKPLPVRSLDLRQLDIPTETYQRGQRKHIVDKIVANFDPASAGVLYVTGPNEQGRYRVWDGGHRLTAMRQLGIEKWNCQVGESSLKDEANNFVVANRDRTSPRQHELHRAALEAGDETAVRIQGIVRAHGWSILPGGAGTRIASVRALYEIEENVKYAPVGRVLKFITETWGHDTEAVQMPMLFGVALLLAKHPDIDLGYARDCFAAYEASRLRHMAKANYSQSASGTKGYDVYVQLVAIYNKRRRSKKLEVV